MPALLLFLAPLHRDKKQTTTQNYRRLGLVARLRAPTGGVEPDRKKATAAAASAAQAPAPASTKPTDPFAIAPATNNVVSEVRVERDATGRIVRILDPSSSSSRKKSSSSSSRPNPLNDPLRALDSDSDSDAAEGQEEEDENDDGEEWGGIDADPRQQTTTEVVRQLEAEASRPVERRPRTQSRREREWLAALVEKHCAGAGASAGSEDGIINAHSLRAMARDRALNPMQQTEADLARRLRKWQAEGGAGDGASS